MELNWLEAILYGLISGIAEFLPVSSRAHQSVLKQLFGGGNTAVLDFLIHIAMLIALYFSCQKTIRIINRTRKQLSIPRSRRKKEPNSQMTALISFLKTACWPVIIMTLFYKLCDQLSTRFQLLAICLVINGIVLYISRYVRTANKDSRFMSRFDSLLIGISSGFGVVPGISRVGIGLSITFMRGVEPRHAFDWMMLISIPAIAALCIADIVIIATVGAGSFGFLLLLKYLISAVFAGLGTFIGISFLRFLVSHRAVGWVSYYCWGLAMFAFVLFML